MTAAVHKKSLHGGIDEAGRGPVMGPLVVAGVAGDLSHFEAMGCKDSKQLLPGRRDHLERLLRLDADVVIAVRSVSPEELDDEMAHRTLNEIEVLRFQSIAQELVEKGATTVTVDAADVDFKRFGARIADALPKEVEVVSRHGADATNAAAAAASIVAKVTRDAAIAQLGRSLERKLPMPLGSGYPGDPKTKAFLHAWVKEFNDLPEGTRRRWSTAKNLLAPKQAELADF